MVNFCKGASDVQGGNMSCTTRYMYRDVKTRSGIPEKVNIHGIYLKVAVDYTGNADTTTIIHTSVTCFSPIYPANYLFLVLTDQSTDRSLIERIRNVRSGVCCGSCGGHLVAISDNPRRFFINLSGILV